MRVTIDRHSRILLVLRSWASVSASVPRESNENDIFVKPAEGKKLQRKPQGNILPPGIVHLGIRWVGSMR
jgi:hypothetical protein